MIVKKIHMKIVIFRAVKNRCMLHGHVFVMDLIFQMISLLPGKVLRLLEFVGFSGNKVCYMSCVTRKPVFRVSDQVRRKPGCTITEDG